MVPVAIRSFTSLMPTIQRSCTKAVLQGTNDLMMALAFSPGARYLAAGGEDGLRIWETSTEKFIPVAPQEYGRRAMVTCVAWLMRSSGDDEIICYGNVNGYFVIMKRDGALHSQEQYEVIFSRRIGSGAEITSIAVHNNGPDVQVGLATRDRSVFTWTFHPNTGELVPIFSKTQVLDEDSVPKVLAFDEGEPRDLYLIGIPKGMIRKGSGADFAAISKHQLGTHIGNAEVHVRQQLCVTDNADDGFDLHRLDTGKLLHKLHTRTVEKTHPKGVKFGDDCRLVIGGSDHGLVYVFETSTGKLLDKLEHSDTGGVETIAVHDVGRGCILIASASSTLGKTSRPIIVWRWYNKPDRKLTVLLFVIGTLTTIALGLAVIYAVRSSSIIRADHLISSWTTMLDHVPLLSQWQHLMIRLAQLYNRIHLNRLQEM